MGRIRRALFAVLCGGIVLQSAAGCEQLVVPLVTDLFTSLLLNALLGGLAT